MRISRLSLRNFGRHRALELDLAPTLTVVRGPNEAGKTTIQQALEYAFFRPPTATAAEVMARRNWSASDDPSVVSIAFTADSGTAGQLTKRFDRSRGTVELSIGGERLNDPAQVTRRMAELTGLPSEKFMRATASIHHHELIGLHYDEATLRDRLQQAISGAEVGTKDARRRLEERMARYRAAGAKHPGDLKVARDEVERLSTALDTGERALAQLEADRRALADARRRSAAAAEQLTALKAERDDVQRAVDLASQHAAADGRWRRYRDAVELRQQLEQHATPERAPGADPPRAAMRSSTPLLATAVALASVAFVAGLVLGGPALVVGVVVAAAALAVGAAVVLLRRRPAPGVASGSAGEAAANQHARLEGELRGLLADETSLSTADLELRRNAAADDAQRCRHALAALGTLAEDAPRRAALLARDVERAARERDEADGAARFAEGRLDANGVDAERVAADAEGLASARDRLAAVERRLRIYGLALDALGAAEQKTMKKVARYLEAEMGADIERITGGRYSRLRVDEASLAFAVQSVERGDWIDEGALSQGTRDQLFLCARLGIIRQATGSARPPLVLDDPFVTFDTPRAQRAIELLRDFAADNQVILLTTSDRYDALAGAVVELPAPAGAELAAASAGA